MHIIYNPYTHNIKGISSFELLALTHHEGPEKLGNYYNTNLWVQYVSENEMFTRMLRIMRGSYVKVRVIISLSKF